MEHRTDTRLEAEAADWFALARSGRMTEQETLALQAWLQADPAHEAAYQSLAGTWRLFGDIADDPSVMEVREWAQATYNRPARLRIAAAIAGAAVLAGGWFSWWAASPAPLPEEIVAAAAEAPDQEFRTGVGQTTTATLFDGSIVTLDTNSTLSAREVGGIRLVELKKGQAFFKVAKDASRPFKVLAAGRTVTATGTAFSVRAEPQRFEVALVEGSVTVEAPRGVLRPGKARDMTPGHVLKVEDRGAWEMAKVDVQAQTSWRTGRLTFHNERLAEAAAEMNRYSRRKIVVAPEIADVPILGVFASGDVDAFAQAAAATGIASVAAADDTRLVLSANEKKNADTDVPRDSAAPSF